MEYIHTYSREDALNDGFLIDVTELAKEAGFKVPAAITLLAYEGGVRVDEDDKNDGQDETGRLWDILNVLGYMIRTSKDTIDNCILFAVVKRQHNKNVSITYKAIMGPGDNMEPVLTIMLPEED